MQQIRITHATWGKSSRKQATSLPIQEKFPLEKGQVLNVDSIEVHGNHRLVKTSFYLYGDHFESITASVPQQSSKPNQVKLEVPYFSQLDNANNPYGSCNVTSVAMCLDYLGYQHKGQGQLEDYLYRWLIDRQLSRHDPYDLEKLIKASGYKDTFTPSAKWDDVKAHLANGFPCIVHGWFTRSGHIIVIVGYDEASKQWIVHDPYGEWYDWGYDTSRSGKYLKYSYKMMQQVCSADNQLWIHYVSK